MPHQSPEVSPRGIGVLWIIRGLGGVGPLAVACLFENVVTLAERAMI